MGIVGKGFLACVAAATVVAAVSIHNQPAPTPPTATEQAAQDAASIRQGAETAAKAAVLSELRDPGNAVFDQVELLSNGVVCGYVNARNGFGGYTGSQPFMFGDPVGGLMMQERGGARFLRLWHTKCVEQSKADIAAAGPIPSGTRRLTPEQRQAILEHLTPAERREVDRPTGQQE